MPIPLMMNLLRLILVFCYQGIIETPEEFAEGLSHGAQLIMGHYIGGANTSLSLITSALINTNQTQNNFSFEDDFKRVIYISFFCPIVSDMCLNLKFVYLGQIPM